MKDPIRIGGYIFQPSDVLAIRSRDPLPTGTTDIFLDMVVGGSITAITLTGEDSQAVWELVTGARGYRPFPLEQFHRVALNLSRVRLVSVLSVSKAWVVVEGRDSKFHRLEIADDTDTVRKLQNFSW